MEHQIIKIPMIDTVFEELDDAFVDQKQTAHEFIWGLIRKLCSDAKHGKLNKSCIVNIIKDGIQDKEDIKLKEVDLVEPEIDESWIPKNMDREDVKYFEHKVTDKTMEYLKLYCSFAILRHEKFGDSIEKSNNERIEKLEKDNAAPKMIEDAKESNAKTISKFRETAPKCLEEIIYASVYPSIIKSVNDNIDKMFDKENEEMYPKVAKTA